MYQEKSAPAGLKIKRPTGARRTDTHLLNRELFMEGATLKTFLFGCWFNHFCCKGFRSQPTVAVLWILIQLICDDIEATCIANAGLEAVIGIKATFLTVIQHHADTTKTLKWKPICAGTYALKGHIVSTRDPSIEEHTAQSCHYGQSATHEHQHRVMRDQEHDEARNQTGGADQRKNQPLAQQYARPLR